MCAIKQTCEQHEFPTGVFDEMGDSIFALFEPFKVPELHEWLSLDMVLEQTLVRL